MSLILDALRKSEAERRRGQAPGLYTSLPPPSTRRRPSALRYLPWIVVAVLVLVALFAFRDHSPATKEELVSSPTVDDEASAMPAPAAVDSVPTAVAPLDPSEAPAPPAAAPLSPAAPATPAKNVDALVNPPSAPANTPPPVAAPLTSVPATAPPPVAAPAAADDALPPVAVLDPGTRNALPPLKLSMHFYNADPSRRFAIIDGHRVTEGTQLGAAVITEIRRDGVVLDVNGQRVLLPRP